MMDSMRDIYKQIVNYFRKPLDIVYGIRSINEWHYDFRRVREGTLGEIIDSLKIAEEIEETRELKNEDILDIFLKTEFVPSLCLCCYAISKFKSVDTIIVDKLASLFLREEVMVRRFAALTLLEIGTIESLKLVVGENNYHGYGVRHSATWQLGEFGAEAESGIPALIKLLDCQGIYWKTHFIAAEALTKIGIGTKNTVIDSLQHENPHVKYYVAYALSQMEIELAPDIENQVQVILDKDIEPY